MNAGRETGFTLLEVLLSVALVTVLTGISFPLYQGLQVRSDLETAAAVVGQMFRRAALLSEGMDGDSPWGVRAEAGAVTLFRGADFAGRDPDFDETFDVSRGIAFGGDTEISFQKFSGVPDVPKSVTLTAPNGESRTVTVNEKGTISY